MAQRRTGVLAAEDRPGRAQLVFGLLLGLLLLASGLYVWHRPHASADGVASDAPSGSASEDLLRDARDAAVRVAAVDAGVAEPPVVVSETRALGCHDRGPKRTSPDECDRLAPVEQALSHSIEQSVECAAPVEKGATIEYVADVSFSRRKVRITLPRAGRSVRDRKVVLACTSAVRDAMLEAMPPVALDGVSHQHARYEIAVTATYRGKGAAVSAMAR